jgi:ketosteroid isomerase-like protein
MAISAMPDPAAPSAPTDAARIRELMLANLFAVFNERNPERRLEAIARNYTEDVVWSDPDGTTHGHEALNEQAQKLLDPCQASCSPPRDRSASAAISAFSPSTWECRSSRRRSAASTSRSCAWDESPYCTRF